MKVWKNLIQDVVVLKKKLLKVGKVFTWNGFIWCVTLVFCSTFIYLELPSEATVYRCYLKHGFVKILQYLQQGTCVSVNKVADLQGCKET